MQRSVPCLPVVRAAWELLVLLLGWRPTASEAEAFQHQKLVIFTEHRDTLNYVQGRIATRLGRQQERPP